MAWVTKVVAGTPLRDWCSNTPITGSDGRVDVLLLLPCWWIPNFCSCLAEGGMASPCLFTLLVVLGCWSHALGSYYYLGACKGRGTLLITHSWANLYVYIHVWVCGDILSSCLSFDPTCTISTCKPVFACPCRSDACLASIQKSMAMCLLKMQVWIVWRNPVQKSLNLRNKIYSLPWAPGEERNNALLLLLWKTNMGI